MFSRTGIAEPKLDTRAGGLSRLLATPRTRDVRIEVLEEKSPGSDGHEFRLFGLGAAGVTAP